MEILTGTLIIMTCYVFYLFGKCVGEYEVRDEQLKKLRDK